MARSVQTEQAGPGSRALALARQEPKLTAILLMAVAGLAIAVYLTLQHYAKVPLVCGTSGLVDCAPVLSSAYSVVPGTQVPITVPGMAWFVGSGALALVGMRPAWASRIAQGRQHAWQVVWSAVGLLFVLYLVYAEIVLLHKICAWCTVVHVLILLTFLVALLRWQETLSGEVAVQPAAARGRGEPQRGAEGQRASGPYGTRTAKVAGRPPRSRR